MEKEKELSIFSKKIIEPIGPNIVNLTMLQNK